MSGADDCDEALERRLAALEDAIHDLEETVSRATNRDIPLLTGTLRALVDADIETLEELPDAGRTFRQHCAEREERLRAVEAQIDALGDAEAAKTTKAEKYGAILSFAHNKRNGNAKVAVSPAEIKFLMRTRFLYYSPSRPGIHKGSFIYWVLLQ
ncbi:hypothetical protein G9464_02570 [Halostella sp. JP-L12]|uniref:hypothetical protein n=1 Tax=Halostella TaxID=1843185 RepID=UPI0013CE7398|nr:MULTISPECIES: hypothetical protein [Halostella]NHN46486.1 hypothetical protein [Halostella sp. JP-L12]